MRGGAEPYHRFREMKIVHVTPTYIPELGYQENHLPFQQAELGHEVHIVTTTSSRLSIHNDRLEIPEIGENVRDDVVVHRIRSLSIDAFGIKIFSPRLEHLLHQLEPDIVHSHEIINISSLRAAMFSKVFDIPCFIDIHVDNDNFHIESRLKNHSFSLFKKAAMPTLRRCVSSFISVNQEATDFAEQRLSIKPEDLTFLPLGVNTDEFPPSPTATVYPDKAPPLGDRLTIVTVGNITETKDIDVLIEAAGHLPADSVNILIIGDGPDEYMDYLQNLVRESQLESSIHFLGTVPHSNLKDYFHLSDVGVWPGKLGVSIMEGVSTGLPVIVCDDDATKFYASASNGLVFDRGDPSELASKINWYIENKEQREIHGRNSRKFAEEELDWSRIAQKSLKIYQEHL